LNRIPFLAIFSDKAILSFRGTEPSELKDLIDDIRVLQIEYKGASVHRGFLEATESLWMMGIEEDLNKLSHRKVYVTGHSLGAAMAVIAGMKYGFEGIVTFGEPRTGANIGKALIGNPRHVRFVNGKDLITTLIPRSRFYIEHGIKKQIPIVEDYEIINGKLFDHSIINYADRIKIISTTFLLD
jgi:predicted lipase